MISTAQDIKKLGKILGVWAHPDDETFSMGGIMAAAATNGQFIAFVTATRGEKGVQDESKWPAAELGNIRSQELAEAMKILGVNNHDWLGFSDGECASCDEQDASQKVSDLIDKYKPDTILTFGPDGLTGHPDHKAVSRWVELACRSRPNITIYHATLTPKQFEASRKADKALNLFFNIERPPVREDTDCAICFSLDEKLCSQKLAALRAMPSQYESMDKFFDGSLKNSFMTEAFVKA